MKSSKIKAAFIILFFFFQIVEGMDYSSSTFYESAEEINNPGQGYYQSSYVTMGLNSFEGKTGISEQVYHLRCDISQFSSKFNKYDRDLSSTALNGLDHLLYQIKNENKNAVIRFAYDPKFDGVKDSPEPNIDQIERHINQLGPILNKHKDTLIAIEAGMIGKWGEMHSSDISSDAVRARIFRHWLEATQDIPILGRTVIALFTFFGKSYDQMLQVTVSPADRAYRLGLYNDCFLSSDSDVGTYEDRNREIEWLSRQNNHVPYGGEVCKVHSRSDLHNCLPEMRLLKLNYLNSGFNSHVTEDKWQHVWYNSNLGSDSIFYNLNGYDYIKRHLGYRLFIASISVNYQQYGSYRMRIEMKNSGFGNLLQKKLIDIIFTDGNDNEIQRSTVGSYSGSQYMEFTGNFLGNGKSSDYKVYLRVYGSNEGGRIYYPVHFANQNIYNGNLKAHFLFNVKNGIIDGNGSHNNNDNNNRPISTDGICGWRNEKRCPSGECCSTFGYCGSSDDFCIYYCDPKYSDCKGSNEGFSTDGKCGKLNFKRCPPGQCCSTFGYCGTDDDFCIKYCDPNYGECKSSKSISTDGNCGKLNGKICPQGECCSTFGYCGTKYAFCNKHCDPNYSQCQPKYEVSNDGNCGWRNGKTCPEGWYCSTFGYCGTSHDFSHTYCDPNYCECGH